MITEIDRFNKWETLEVKEYFERPWKKFQCSLGALTSLCNQTLVWKLMDNVSKMTHDETIIENEKRAALDSGLPS